MLDIDQLIVDNRKTLEKLQEQYPEIRTDLALWAAMQCLACGSLITPTILMLGAFSVGYILRMQEEQGVKLGAFNDALQDVDTSL